MVQQWLGSVGGFPFFISEHAELSHTPHNVPMDWGEIRVGLYHPLCRVLESDRPGFGPSRGDGGSITSTFALPQSWAWTWHPTFSLEKGIFLNNNNKIPTLNMFLRRNKD